VDLILDGPSGQLVPLIERSSVYRQAIFRVLVLAFFKIVKNFLHSKKILPVVMTTKLI